MTEIQTCQLVEAVYVEDAADKRAPFREEHLERMAKLFKEGALITAGAYEDMSATMMLLAVDSAEAAEAVVKTDVYWKNGIWTGYSIKKFNRVELGG